MPRFANATLKPDVEFVYSGKISELIEKVIEKLPAIDIPNKNINIFFAIRLPVKIIAAKRKNEIIKPNSSSVNYVDYFAFLAVPNKLNPSISSGK
jgi:hypothetical protein